MGVRIGVDVGGTFTKAVGLDLAAGSVVARASVPTTHDHDDGVAAGVVACVDQVAREVGAAEVELVVHSTTQAVNALLEGDVGVVGVIGLGRRPELARVRKRTDLSRVELSPSRYLETRPAFFDITEGIDRAALRATLAGWIDDGVSAVAVAEAFAPDDATVELEVVAEARALGLPACASSELSGLYGLELRTLTAAVNASILPIALRTAEFVEQGVAAAGIEAPVMVMRGDGGATDLEGFRRAPVRTLYSGPAASVAGALRFSGVADAVVIEVGGTSTNVAAVRDGQPALSYVQVASHSTALRSVDVRVIGVAGGSMLRVRRRRVYGVGPRSAHIAGLPYATFLTPDRLAGAEPVEFAPRPGDPADYLALRLGDGTMVALTNTCAANALGVVEPDDYAAGDGEAARAAFEVAGRLLRLPGAEVARRMLEASGNAVCELVDRVSADHDLHRPPVVAVGGGGGGLGRHVATMLRSECRVPPSAEVISSIGDALSMLRAERERTVDITSSESVDALVAEVEAELQAAGASPSSIDVRVEEDAERGTVRAVGTGAVVLRAGAVPGRAPATDEEVRQRADALGLPQARAVGSYWLLTRAEPSTGRSPLAVLDRFADPVIHLDDADLVVSTGDDLPVAVLIDAAARRTRHRGPLTIEPTVWVLRDHRLTELTSGDRVGTAAQLAEGAPEVAVIVGRE